jgi:hypothetical protein
MNINALTPLPAAATRIPGAAAAKNEDFKHILEQSGPTAAARRQHDAEEAAAGLVSHALILPILRQLRRDPFNQEGYFSPGIGEKTFGPEFDMQIADRIAHSPQLGIRKALAQRMLNGGPQKGPTHKDVDVHG